MRALVTGGGGFLGARICHALHERGADVVALGRNVYPVLDAAGITTIQADVRDAAALRRACEGMDIVFHVAAIPGIWGPRKMFVDINVTGTENVIEACRRHRVPKLVFTSSPSVVFGEQPLCGVDESQPYPDRYLAHYPETKAAAERMVLAANDASLATVALRPHLIWGPGDPHLIPRVVQRAREGKLVQVGNGENLVDVTYIDNAAAAHLNAADALLPGSTCTGKAYFISQGEPVILWPWLNDILEQLGVARVSKRISYATARRLGTVMEVMHRLFLPHREPRMTRFLATQLAHSHYFDISAAHRDIGYQPDVSTGEGLQRLLTWLRRAHAA